MWWFFKCTRCKNQNIALYYRLQWKKKIRTTEFIIRLSLNNSPGSLYMLIYLFNHANIKYSFPNTDIACVIKNWFTNIFAFLNKHSTCCDFFFLFFFFWNYIIIIPAYLTLLVYTHWVWILFNLTLDTSCFSLEELKSTQILPKHMWHVLFLILRLETLIFTVRDKQQNSADLANYPYTANSEGEIKIWEGPSPENCVRFSSASNSSASFQLTNAFGESQGSHTTGVLTKICVVTPSPIYLSSPCSQQSPESQ